MPDFTFSSPDGKKYTVTGPPGATSAQAFSILQGQIGGSDPSTETPVQKMAKSEVGDVGAADSVVRGMTLGWEPEVESDIVGGAVGADNMIRGAVGAKPLPYTGTEARTAVRDRLDTQYSKFNSEHPYISEAGELGGGLVGAGTRAAADFIGGAKSLLGSAGRSAVVGAGAGAVAGASSDKDRLASAKSGAETGATLGVAAPFLGAAVNHGLPIIAPFFKRVGSGAVAGTKEIWDHITSAFEPKGTADRPVDPEAHAKATAAALDYVHRLSKTLQSSPDKLRATDPVMKAKGITAGEAMGRGGITELTTAGRVSGPSADIIESKMRDRNLGTPERVQNDLAEASGLDPAAVSGNLEDLHASLKEKASPLYDAAFTLPDGTARVLDTPEIRKLMQKPAVKDSFGRVVRALRNLGEDPAALGFDLHPVERSKSTLPAKIGTAAPESVDFEGVSVRMPTVKLLHYIKSGATAALYEKATNPLTGKFEPDWFQSTDAKVLQQLRDALTDVPEYKLANDAGGDVMQMQEAQNITPKLLSNATDEHTFAKRWAGLTPAQKQTVAGATVAHYYALVRSGRLRPKDFNPSMNPAWKSKMIAILGQQGAQKFAEHMAAETKLTSWANRIMPGVGSHTAEVRAGEERASIGLAKSAGYAAISMGHKNILGALGHMANAGSYWRAAKLGHIDQVTRQEVSRLLLLPPDQLASELDKMVKKEAATENDPKAVEAIKKTWNYFQTNPRGMDLARRALVSLQENEATPKPSHVSSQLGLQ